MKKVLLLGRIGQVGFELERLLKGRTELIAPEQDEIDFTKPQIVVGRVRELKPDVIINASAYTAVDNAEKDEALAQALNATAPGLIAQEAQKLGALLVHYSTDYVYDGSKREPYVETDPPKPMSAYGRTKLAGDEAIRASGCRHLILRTAWVYASRGKNFVLTMLRLANERPALRVVADQVGSPTLARSLAQATVQAIEAGGEGLFHATNAGQVSWHGFAERIIRRGAELGLCKAVPVEPITSADYPLPTPRPAYSVLSNEQLNRLGVRLPEWEAALDACLAELTKK